MKILIDIKDEKADFMLELLRDLSFVKILSISNEKHDILNGTKKAVNEVKSHKEGKIKLKSAK